MSRNNDRSGFTDTTFTQDETPAPVVTSTPGVGPSTGGGSPVFNWSVPTEFVTLPSAGRFYPTDHPLHHKTTVEIRYMTAKEEDILTSRSLLKEGIALDRMLQNILVEGSIRVGSLLLGDKNALIIAARRTGYGADYTTRVNCPACQTPDEFTFDITNPPVNNFEEDMEQEGISFTEVGTFMITLPMTKATVECALLTGDDEVRMYKAQERRSRQKKEETGGLTDALRSYIVGVNGEGSPIVIESFIQSLPARDARILRKLYTKVVPNVNLNQEYSCPNCSYETDMEVPLTADFFWPDR
tara:strand:- start:4786 stop:5682 length:897 start_codon:yes stop_codon:yes gene_type:complete